MVYAKNYETVSTFLKVVQKKTVASFFWTQCIWRLINCRIIIISARQHICYSALYAIARPSVPLTPIF